MRVLNITSGDRPRFNQALRKIEEGLCAWVEYGVSVRTLTLAEQIQARNKIAASRERISRPEAIACRFRHPGSAVGRRIAKSANVFSYLADRGLFEAAEIVLDTLSAA